MANIKSQKKRILTNEKRRVRNRNVSTALRTYVKRFNQAVEGGDSDTARTALQFASRQLDKAASKGVIHANSAANRKSAMAKTLNSRTS
ncbi:MAG TPA: 30S ribosomal protein S20 [Actinomycetota bacterium]|nr:30S ribosomal protein S20 [Actinomycetota bacterium]